MEQIVEIEVYRPLGLWECLEDERIPIRPKTEKEWQQCDCRFEFIDGILLFLPCSTLHGSTRVISRVPASERLEISRRTANASGGSLKPARDANA